VLASGDEDARAPSVAVAREREVAILLRKAVLDKADTVPGIKPRMERAKAGWHRGQRHVESEEASAV
jgi:hypothetical protein